MTTTRAGWAFRALREAGIVVTRDEVELEMAQRRERTTGRYRCALCHERSWNQVCVTCAPAQHPSALDPEDA